jgi:hypothetical protein
MNQNSSTLFNQTNILSLFRKSKNKSELMSALTNHDQRRASILIYLLILLPMFQKTMQNADYVWQVEPDNLKLNESQCLEFFPGHHEEV